MVSRHEVKTLAVVHDLRVVAGHRPGHHIVYGVSKGQGQIMGLAQVQHFGEIALGFAIFVGSSFFIDLAACGATGGYVIGMKKALVIAPAPPSKVFSIVKCVCQLPKSLDSCGFAGLSL